MRTRRCTKRSVRLKDALPFQFIFQVVARRPCEIQDVGDYKRDGAGEEYLLVHTEVFGHRSAYEDAYSDTDVPAAQVGAVGRAALVVAGEIHAHSLVAREY